MHINMFYKLVILPKVTNIVVKRKEKIDKKTQQKTNTRVNLVGNPRQKGREESKIGKLSTHTQIRQ